MVANFILSFAAQNGGDHELRRQTQQGNKHAYMDHAQMPTQTIKLSVLAVGACAYFDYWTTKTIFTTGLKIFIMATIMATILSRSTDKGAIQQSIK